MRQSARVWHVVMKLSIARCFYCKRVRLIDKSTGKNTCFSCKQKIKKK